MSTVFHRHPRYAVLVFAILAGTVWLLFADSHGPILQSGSRDLSLSARVSRAENIYQKILKGRKGLIGKFGPTPEKITMFPPDVSPWPPYTVWDFFPPAFNCPHERERIGTLGDGGKWVCGLSRVEDKKNCVVYSFGINGESSFEAEILNRTNHCEIWGYDFSVNSFGPEIPASEKHRTHFHPYGLAGNDNHGPENKVKYYTLQSLMDLNDHKFIDILKIDVESWEFEVLAAFVEPYLQSDRPLPFGQLQIELHTWDKEFPELLKWWEKLEQGGLRPFFQEPNMVYNNYNRGRHQDLTEYSFINIRGRNAFVSDD
ncbi:methyltransferase domain-containing protein [Cristinia sonorae]|uniref:Methyltransferase domain-containing protein n=1 Tax=Cristinia sonorae TaxID=1940300 RepID=A0A8K0UEW6_9AGAR|nr:methyltransferase domain-containing protein [Cristinia sonorae]